MEILVIVDAQHKSQYYSRSRSQRLARFNSTPSKKFSEVNCRTFYATKGFLPSPRRASSIAAIKVNLRSPTTEKSSGASHLESTPKSTPIPINTKPLHKEEPVDSGFFNGSLSFSERWAGPAYSSSPPPSCLPIPKFLQLPKRTMSLDLPRIVSDVSISPHLIAKSAPVSPTRKFSPLPTKDLFCSADSATNTLRRILNLDSDDE